MLCPFILHPIEWIVHMQWHLALVNTCTCWENGYAFKPTGKKMDVWLFLLFLRNPLHKSQSITLFKKVLLGKGGIVVFPPDLKDETSDSTLAGTKLHSLTWVNPSLIRLCLKVLANCSSSSRSLGSSKLGVSIRFGVDWLCGSGWMGVAAIVRVGVAGY